MPAFVERIGFDTPEEFHQGWFLVVLMAFYRIAGNGEISESIYCGALHLNNHSKLLFLQILRGSAATNGRRILLIRRSVIEVQSTAI